MATANFCWLSVTGPGMRMDRKADLEREVRTTDRDAAVGGEDLRIPVSADEAPGQLMAYAGRTGLGTSGVGGVKGRVSKAVLDSGVLGRGTL